jgi:hypothetical protein
MTELLRDEKWVFAQYGDSVYRAPSSAPVMPDGTIGGARFFCPLWQWQQRQESGVYPFDQRAIPGL